MKLTRLKNVLSFLNNTKQTLQTQNTFVRNSITRGNSLDL